MNIYIPIVYDNYNKAEEELRRQWTACAIRGFDTVAEIKHKNSEIRISYLNGNDIVIFAVDSKNLGKIRGRRYDRIYIEDTVDKDKISEFLTKDGKLWIL